MTPTYRLARRFFRTTFPCYFGWRTFNIERLPADGPVILASNHASFVDPPLIGSSLPRQVNFLARDTLFRFPPMGWLLRSLEAVPVDRDGGGAAGLRTILDRLQAGRVILLFPEGTRTRDGRFQKPRTGIGLAVIKSSAPVLPVRVFGTFEAYGRHLRFPHPRRRIIVKFGRPISFAELRAEAQTCSKARLKQIYQQTTDEIMAAIARLEPCVDKETFP